MTKVKIGLKTSSTPIFIDAKDSDVLRFIEDWKLDTKSVLKGSTDSEGSITLFVTTTEIAWIRLKEGAKND